MAEACEYFANVIQADAKQHENEMKQAGTWVKNIQQYSAVALTVPLNEIGSQGWELVHMEAVFVGENGDLAAFKGVGVLATHWTHSYFCVFKRRKSGEPPQSESEAQPIWFGPGERG